MEDEVRINYEQEYDRLWRQLSTERRRRREAERMCAVYGSMATWGGAVMILLSAVLFFVAK